ncbi:hypothetical protein [Porphyromonas levii]|uniref:hypothetical protein n=2 Tax=Porphyromonas levii TaxID=28114 RepID=UPI0014616BB5|nr:hypothetical protein [Porphyromonas levii]
MERKVSKEGKESFQRWKRKFPTMETYLSKDGKLFGKVDSVPHGTDTPPLQKRGKSQCVSIAEMVRVQRFEEK